VNAYVYRDAAAADAPALAALARTTWLDTFGPLFTEADAASHVSKYYGASQQAAEIADPSFHHHLAFDGDALVGFCRSGRYTLPTDVRGARALELHRLYVVEAPKGSGAARRLMDDAVAWAKSVDGDGLYLSVYHANERAISFYRKCGFGDFSEHVFMVGATSNRMFIMRRPLR
jgi:ribosomal protein S18 acetylase RimI-like enzyme